MNGRCIEEAAVRWKPCLWASLVSSALLPGCALGPDAPPEVASPSLAFAEVAATTSGAGLEPAIDYAFWRDLGDPVLTSLVERGLGASPDVTRATARIRESRAVAGAAWAALLPEVDGGASYARTRLSSQSPLLSQVGATNLPGFNFDPDADDFKASVTMAYELD